MHLQTGLQLFLCLMLAAKAESPLVPELFQGVGGVALESGDSWVLEDFFDGNAVVIVLGQHLLDEVFDLLREDLREVVGPGDLVVADLLLDLLLGASFEGELPTDHDVEDHADGPDVSGELDRVWGALDGFWRKVEE